MSHLYTFFGFCLPGIVWCTHFWELFVTFYCYLIVSRIFGGPWLWSKFWLFLHKATQSITHLRTYTPLRRGLERCRVFHKILLSEKARGVFLRREIGAWQFSGLGRLPWKQHGIVTLGAALSQLSASRPNSTKLHKRQLQLFKYIDFIYV